MRAIGLDIGTTTICAVVVHGDTGEIIDSITVNNDALSEGFAVLGENAGRFGNLNKSKRHCWGIGK